jgi:carboxypeptidase C (cathepsin A)
MTAFTSVLALNDELNSYKAMYESLVDAYVKMEKEKRASDKQIQIQAARIALLEHVVKMSADNNDRYRETIKRQEKEIANMFNKIQELDDKLRGVQQYSTTTVANSTATPSFCHTFVQLNSWPSPVTQTEEESSSELEEDEQEEEEEEETDKDME